MKKAMLLILFFIATITGAFAAEMAMGGGLLYNNAVTSGAMKAWVYDDSYRNDGNEVDWSMRRNGFGIFGFFNCNRYTELNFGVLYKNPGDLSGEEITVKAMDAGLHSIPAFQLGLHFMYPVYLTNILVFFPLCGIDFEFALAGKRESWWDDSWLRAGLGMDFFLSGRLFLRSQVMYGYAIPSWGDRDLGLDFGHGLLVKAGLGKTL